MNEITDLKSPRKGRNVYLQEQKASMRSYTPLDRAFEQVARNPSEISGHARTLKGLASEVDTVAEFGVRWGLSTICFLAAKPKNLFSYDINPSLDASRFQSLSDPATAFRFEVADSRTVVLPAVDLLFIDTDHNYQQMAAELAWNASRVSHRIVAHDTASHPDVLAAIRHFCCDNPRWEVIQHFDHCCGLTIIERVSPESDW